jgi:tight adherence protein C
MTGPILLWGSCIAAGISVAAGLWMLCCMRRSGGLAPVDGSLPWWVRLPWVPASRLAPVLADLLSDSVRQRLQQRLEAANLHPGAAPEQWIAVRLVHGCVAGAAACVVALALRASPVLPAFAGAIAGGMAGGLWLKRTLAAGEKRILRELPAYLDLLTVCVEAGATLTAGIRLIVQESPSGPLRSYFDRVLREIRSGRLRSEAFTSVATSYGVESLQTLASALAHAEASGMSLGQVLRAQSEQRNAERFVRAERLAMLAPVKMLGPLILCIFPCTFIVLAIPVIYRLTEEFSR